MRLSAQLLLEQGDFPGWLDLLAGLDRADGLDPAWARAVLAAPLYSERSDEILAGLEAMLVGEDARLLHRLLDTLIVFETRLDEDMLARLSDRDEATRYAIAAYWKQPLFRSWVPFMRWSLPLWSAWPAALVPRLSEVASIFARATAGIPNGFSQSIAQISYAWLVEIEDARHPGSWNDRREPFGIEREDFRSWEKIEERLREVLVAAVDSSLVTMRNYLQRLTTTAGLRGARADLIESPGIVPARMPHEWTDLCLKQFVPRRRRARRDGLLGVELFSWNDYLHAGIRSDPGLSPASPLRSGFDQLFEADPAQALRLFHRLERRASVYWRWYNKCHDGKRPVPVRVDLGHRKVILWGDDPVYRWSRGILGSSVLGSAYLALDDWLERQVTVGRPVGELIDLVLRNHGLVATAAPLLAILGEQINTPGAIDHAGPFLAVPRLWSYDVKRHIDDQGFAHRIGYFSADNVHFQANERNHQRHAKRSPLHHALLLPFRLMAGGPTRDAFDAARAGWSAANLTEFEGELEDEALTAERTAQIERFRSDGDPAQIVIEEAERGIHVSIAPPEQDLPDIEAMGIAKRLLEEGFALSADGRDDRGGGAGDGAPCGR